MAMNELKETMRHTRCSQATESSKKFASMLNLLFAFVLRRFFRVETKYCPIIEFLRHATRDARTDPCAIVFFTSIGKISVGTCC